MRSSAAVALSLLALLAGAQGPPQFQQALPGYKYEFPRDYFDHPEYQTEWWYYTGNLRAADGRRFGFELTFFRHGLHPEIEQAGTWDVRDVYLAHLALSDLSEERFYHQERMNRAGPGIAGVSAKAGRIWDGNWSSQWKDGGQVLQAVARNFSVELHLNSQKPPVINGKNGASQKGDGAGRASHYISLTRLDAEGKILLQGEEFEVKGLAWMDHEFFTHQLEPDQTGWDWVSVQLEDKTELMLFRIRRKDGSIDAHSAGTYVDAQGNAQQLELKDFAFEPDGLVWTSLSTEARYPIQWRIAVPKLDLKLEVTTSLREQELPGDGQFVPAYWEGAVDLRGWRGEEPVKGVGYLEMTGYAGGMGGLRAGP